MTFPIVENRSSGGTRSENDLFVFPAQASHEIEDIFILFPVKETRARYSFTPRASAAIVKSLDQCKSELQEADMTYSLHLGLAHAPRRVDRGLSSGR